MTNQLDLHLPPGLRVGLLGGSFNPAHEAHREISLAALRLLRLDKVVWLVSPQNPLKSSEGMASLDDRANFAASVAGHKDITVSRVEEQMGTEYTADTVRELKRRFAGVHFVFLLGSDNLLQLPRWRRWTDLVNLVPFAVFARPGSARSAPFGQAATRFSRARLHVSQAANVVQAPTPAWVFIPHTSYNISSTAIRASGESPFSS